MSGLTTDAELADQFGITVAKLHDLRKRNGWPCVRLGRFDVRFTEEQVEQIVAMQTDAPERKPAVHLPAVSGQTARSAARKRAS